MANYFVIGGDNKEYGPVTEADVRQWIAEGRLNGDSKVKLEGGTELRTLGELPEFATALKPSATSESATGPQDSRDFLDRDYEIDIGESISRAWTIYKENFGTLFVSILIVFIIQMVAGFIIGAPFGRLILSAPLPVRVGWSGLNNAILSLINGPLIGGLMIIYLSVIRGRSTGLGELFAGFQRAYLRLFLGSLVLAMISFVCMLPVNYVWQSSMGDDLAKLQQRPPDPAAVQEFTSHLASGVTHCLPVLLICLVPLTFFTVNFQFVLPLIIDRGMTVSEAMRTSWRMVMRHWWHLFGLTIVVGLLVILGLAGCCICVLFTAPIGLAAMLLAYETIFGTRKN